MHLIYSQYKAKPDKFLIKSGQIGHLVYLRPARRRNDYNGKKEKTKIFTQSGNVSV